MFLHINVKGKQFLIKQPLWAAGLSSSIALLCTSQMSCSALSSCLHPWLLISLFSSLTGFLIKLLNTQEVSLTHCVCVSKKWKQLLLRTITNRFSEWLHLSIFLYKFVEHGDIFQGALENNISNDSYFQRVKQQSFNSSFFVSVVHSALFSK